MSMYDKTHCGKVISLQLIKINGKKKRNGLILVLSGIRRRLYNIMIKNMDSEVR